MDKTLEERRKQVESQFENLKTQRQQKEEEIAQVDTEMARLQGEWRLINDLAGVKNVSTEADKLDVKEVKDAKA